jgi:hypothetical protein
MTLRPDPPSFSRPCAECGKIHDTGFQNEKTKEVLHRFDKCYDCYTKSAYTYKPINGPVKLADGLGDILDKLKRRMNK